MLRVTVELVPFGDESRKKTIGIMNIANDGRGSSEVGHYDVRLEDDRDVERNARVLHYQRSRGAWSLVRRALEACGL